MKQISVFVENRPGSLMEVTSKLVEAEINIRAVSSFVHAGVRDSSDGGGQSAESQRDLTHLGFVVR